MDNETILTKTAKGLGETLGKTKYLSRDHRKILKEIDGRARLSDLRTQLEMDAEKLQVVIDKLLADGYIHEFGGVDQPDADAIGDTGFDLGMVGAIEVANSHLSIDDFFRAMQQPPPSPAASLDLTALASLPQAAGAVPQPVLEADEPQVAPAQDQAAEEARQEAEKQARIKLQQEARRATQEAARRESRERALRKTEELARQTAEEQVKKLAEEKAQMTFVANARKEAEAKARQTAEELARKLAEQNVQLAAESRGREEAEAKARQTAEELARKLAEQNAQLAAESRAREDAEARARQAAEELARKLAEQNAQLAAEAHAREEVQFKARRAAEEQLRELAEQNARMAADARAREEAQVQIQAQARKLAEELAKSAALEQARIKAREAVRRAAEEQAQREAQAQARAEAERQAVLRAEEAARLAAEQQAQRELEEQARKLAEEQARREAEDRLRLQAVEQVRLAAEQEALRVEQAQAKQAELARVRQEIEQAARIKAEEKARQKAEQKARKEAEAQARRAAKEEERQAAEAAARLKAETAARLMAEKQAAKEAQEVKEAQELQESGKPAQQEAAPAETASVLGGEGGKKPVLPANSGKLVRLAALALAVLAAVGLGLLHVIPFNGRQAELEQAASVQFGQPVKIGSMNLALFPQPHWRLQQVAVGNEGQIVVRQVNAGADIGSLFSGPMRLRSIALLSPVVNDEGLGWLLFRQSPNPAWQMASLRARDLQLRSRHVQLPAFDADAEIGADGGWRKIVLDAAAGEMRLELQRVDGRLHLEMTARNLVLPFGGTQAIETFNASGTVQPDALEFSKFSGVVHGGTLSGTGVLRWNDGWMLTGEAQARQIDTTKLMPALLQGGALDANFSYAMKAGEVGKLFAAPQARGGFHIGTGVLLGVDLASLVMGQAGSGKSTFKGVSGDFVFADGKTRLSPLQLSSGLLSAVGSATANASGKLDGQFSLDLRTASRQARATLSVSGTLAAPEFSR